MNALLVTFAWQEIKIRQQLLTQPLQTFRKRDEANPRNVAVPYDFRELAKTDRPLEFRHGTLNTYAHHRCRCDECRAVWNAYQVKLQGKRRYLSSHKKFTSQPSLFQEQGAI